ncbi:MAG: transcription antitermination factor NusB [Planctomycetia bacterium]|nr:transcription antitermination factor NusB [Planctomycetia bacterium]
MSDKKNTPKQKSVARLRKISRVLAFQALYQDEIAPEQDDNRWTRLFELYCDTSEMISGEERQAIIEFSKLLVEGYHDRHVEVDDLILKALDKSRTIARLSPIERNILRMAAYEIRFVQTPRAIVISEALNLSNQFGDKGSSNFVNGVLDKITSTPEEA